MRSYCQYHIRRCEFNGHRWSIEECGNRFTITTDSIWEPYQRKKSDEFLFREEKKKYPQKFCAFRTKIFESSRDRSLERMAFVLSEQTCQRGGLKPEHSGHQLHKTRSCSSSSETFLFSSSPKFWGSFWTKTSASNFFSCLSKTSLI